MITPLPCPCPQVAGRVSAVAADHGQAGAGPAGAAESGCLQSERGRADRRGETRPPLGAPWEASPMAIGSWGRGSPVLTRHPSGPTQGHAGGAEYGPGSGQPGHTIPHAWTASAHLDHHTVLVGPGDPPPQFCPYSVFSQVVQNQAWGVLRSARAQMAQWEGALSKTPLLPRSLSRGWNLSCLGGGSTCGPAMETPSPISPWSRLQPLTWASPRTRGPRTSWT